MELLAKTFIVNMTSQHWLTEADVDRTEWYHDVVITLPKDIDPDLRRSCMFLIDKGSNKPNRILKESTTAVQARVSLTDSTIFAFLQF